jgi:hypothetical protein
LRLDAAEDRVRYRTQHVGDTTRLPQTRLREVLNRVYRQTRTKLQVWAPQLYVATSGDLVLTAVDQIGLTSVALPFEGIHRIETKAIAVNGFSTAFDTWQMVERSGGYPEVHGSAFVTWEQRALLVFFHPEGYVSGTFRVLYHFTPTDLSDPAHIFELPAALDDYLISKAAEEVYQGDRNYAEARVQKERAQGRGDDADGGELAEAKQVLYRLYGQHGDNAGPVELLGY